VPRGVAVGHGDPPLSKLGWRQVAQLAKQLEAEPLQRVFSSDLARARLTAQRIAVVHGLPVHVCPELREIHFGVWEGRSLSELWSEEAEEAEAWERDLRRVPSGFGERFEALELRVAQFRVLLNGCHVAAVVGHRGPLAVLLHQMSGISIEKAWQQPLQTGAALKLEIPESKAMDLSRH